MTIQESIQTTSPCPVAGAKPAAIVATIWLLMSGCASMPIVEQSAQLPTRTVEQIVFGLEENGAKLDRALVSGDIRASARFKDEKGRPHDYNLEGLLIFQKPWRLRIDLRPALGDQVMAVGSNDEDYWVWIEPNMGTMRWGRHRYAGQPCAAQSSIRSDQLAMALGVGGLPSGESGLSGPVKVSGAVFDQLAYRRMTDAGESVIDREFGVDRAPPYQLRTIHFFDDHGTVSMSARLDDYRPAWPGGPMVAHSINVLWPGDEGQLKLTIGATKGMESAKLKPRTFVRPERGDLPRGIHDIIQIDANCEQVTASVDPAGAR